MRIFTPLAITLVFSVFLTGCGGEETPTEKAEEEGGGAQEATVAATTTEETNNRAEATVEETTAMAEATAPTAHPEAASVPTRSETALQEAKQTSAPPEEPTRDRAQVEEGISITQTAAPDPATVGRPLTFTVLVTNSSFPQHVGFKDFLPPGTTLVSATPSQGFCGTLHHGGNLFDCTLGTIPSGGTVAVEVVTIPTVPGILTNLAQAGGGFAPVTSAPTTVAVNAEPGSSLG